MLFLNRLASVIVLMGVSQASSAITVQFDYTYDSNNFFSTHPNSQAALTAAGNYFAQHLTDSLGAIDSSGLNHIDVSFTNPSSSATVTINNFDVAANTVIIYVGAQDLGANVLGEGGPGGFNAEGSTAFINSLNRGQGVVSGPSATDFSIWGGKVSFSSTTNWYFDADPSTVENFGSQNDFYSVALHELGHVFGIGLAPSWSNKISGSNFTGANAVAVNGGNVALADTGHWLNGTLSTVAGVAQEAAMDPSLIQGTRKYFTDLDNAALKDIGWQVSATPVPLPAAAYLFFGSVLGLLRFVRKAG